MERKPDPYGLREGIARSVSQACIYGLEARKTLLQVYGKIPAKGVPGQWLPGMITSSVTSGLVFGAYFSVYNRLHAHWFAGTVAAFSTSLVKIPISNGMRLMQTGAAPHLFAATRKIVAAKSWRGLYTGYRLSLMEDIIEMDLRARLYKALRTDTKENGQVWRGFSGGAISSSIASGITTPFDTLRSHMAIHASNRGKCVKIIPTMRTIIQKHGIMGLYHGATLRVASNAIKGALFFSLYEMLP